MIQIENFCKNYFEFPHKSPSFSIHDISFTVNDGEICGLVGPNGSGKTTIIKAICGFHNPSSGKISITNSNNSAINEQSDQALVMENIGYVPEISILPNNMKVIDFLFYAASIHNINNKKESVEKVITKCELSKVVNKKISALSKGYKQRVSFAQAIIHNPKNIILDEPISGLDPSQIVQMRNLIKELAADKAILISTHILQEVTSLCSKVFIIHDGEMVANGTKEDIISQQKVNSFEEAFIKLTSTSNQEQ